MDIQKTAPAAGASPFHPFVPQPSPGELPRLFTCPFFYHPHPLAVRAAEEVKRHIARSGEWNGEAGKGKMFGVLIVEKEGRTGFLAAYSGLLAGRNDLPYFVPPVYDLLQPDSHFKKEEQKISGINRHIRALKEGNLHQALTGRITTCRDEREKELSAARAAMKEAKRRRDELRATSGNRDEAALVRESKFLKAEYKRLEKQWDDRLEDLERQLQRLEARIQTLKTERKHRSEALQEWLFGQYHVLNARGEEKTVWRIFQETRRQAPPSGSGECAAPKLLQYAYRHGFRPLAMAEFWWGSSPRHDIRRHGDFYPACHAKCGPILGHMLQGLDVEPNPQENAKHAADAPRVLYEDEWILAVDKPAGMLSVPGKGNAPSVQEWVQAYRPEAQGPLIVHRLDMDTSGVLLLAKTAEAHRLLQQQFENRTVKKRYVALLDGEVRQDRGFIRLPLRPNPDDRPRQVVDPVHGKMAVTRFEVLERNGGRTRIAFYPETGRTHQLRVHAAHSEGLNSPIAGDNLYGQPDNRLYLHAESVCFRHVVTGKPMRITAPVPF